MHRLAQVRLQVAGLSNLRKDTELEHLLFVGTTFDGE